MPNVAVRRNAHPLADGGDIGANRDEYTSPGDDVNRHSRFNLAQNEDGCTNNTRRERVSEPYSDRHARFTMTLCGDDLLFKTYHSGYSIKSTVLST